MDPRRLRTRVLLMDAVERLIADQGLERVSVEDVCREAGVAVTSLYNAFGNRTGLLAAVIDRALDTDRRYLDVAYAPGRAPLAALVAAGQAYLHFAVDHPGLFRLLAFPPDLGLAPDAVAITTLLAERVAGQSARLVAVLARGAQDGALRPVDPQATAIALWAAWNGIISLAWRPDELQQTTEQLTHLIDLATELLTDGLRLRDLGRGSAQLVVAPGGVKPRDADPAPQVTLRSLCRLRCGAELCRVHDTLPQPAAIGSSGTCWPAAVSTARRLGPSSGLGSSHR